MTDHKSKVNQALKDNNIDSEMFDEVAGILEYDNNLDTLTAERLAFRSILKSNNFYNNKGSRYD